MNKQYMKGRYINMWFDFEGIPYKEAGIFPDRVEIPPLLNDVLAKLANVDKDEDFETIVQAARPVLFNFDYSRFASHPLSNSDREYIELCILNHFITRRICSGNVKKWRLWFSNKIREIMPYYEDMIWSMKLDYDPLQDHELWDTFHTEGNNNTQNAGSLANEVKNIFNLDTTTRDVTDTDTTNNSVTDETTDTTTENSGTTTKQGSENHSDRRVSIDRYSDTPQSDASAVWEITYDQQGNPVGVLTDVYLTNIRGITESTSGNSSNTESGTSHNEGEENVDHDVTTRDTGTVDTTVNGTVKTNTSSDTKTDQDTTDDTWNQHDDDGEHHYWGMRSHTYQALVKEYRENLLQIIAMICDELEPLFYSLVETYDFLDFV